MCAYNKINGTYASEHRWLLTEVLRDEWGFDGVVVSDWGAVNDRVAALAAGLDLEMPPDLGRSDVAVVAAVESRRRWTSRCSIGRVRGCCGWWTGLGRRSPSWRVDDARTTRWPARRPGVGGAAEERWRHPAAPPAVGRTVAVIGEFARTPRYQGAGIPGSTRPDSICPGRVDRRPAPRRRPVRRRLRVGRRPTTTRLRTRRSRRPARADHVVVFLGLPADAESEGFDRRTWTCPRTNSRCSKQWRVARH